MDLINVRFTVPPFVRDVYRTLKKRQFTPAIGLGSLRSTSSPRI